MAASFQMWQNLPGFTATVSRVLNGSGYVSKKSEKRL